jgi:membrane protease YdiL (CAAX protease family)
MNLYWNDIKYVFGKFGRFYQQLHDDVIEKDRTRLDYRPFVVLILTAVSLTVQEYVGDRNVWSRLHPQPGYYQQLHNYWELGSFAWWAGWRVIGYLIVPAIVVLFMPGERLRDYGWSPRGFFKHIGAYAGLYSYVLVLCIIMSHTKAFQNIYPFYRLANRSTKDLVLWELLYAAQFLSLEFFFRGFMLNALKRSLGVHAIWVMVVPYCMIHFGKTFAETMAAIVAGSVLGTIALRTKSIWGGVFIHIGVAITMDLLTLKYLPIHHYR